MRKDPLNPIVTSVPGESYERHDPDHLKPKYYNPESILQKSGHGSYIDLPTGETYLVHLCSRPFAPELRCTWTGNGNSEDGMDRRWLAAYGRRK